MHCSLSREEQPPPYPHSLLYQLGLFGYKLQKSSLAYLSSTVITLEEKGWPTKTEETNISEKAETTATPEI